MSIYIYVYTKPRQPLQMLRLTKWKKDKKKCIFTVNFAYFSDQKISLLKMAPFCLVNLPQFPGQFGPILRKSRTKKHNIS